VKYRKDKIAMAEIVPCLQTDLKQLKEVSIETFSDTFGYASSEEDLQNYLEKAYNIDKLQKELETPDVNFYLLKEEEEIIGYFKINIGNSQTEHIGDNCLEIERFYIRKGFKRHGYGRKMMKFIHDLTKYLNRDCIWLGVWEHNQPALNFYSKMGFKRIGQHDFYVGADRQTDYIVSKYL
ncbi:GNAT family N-acetyltransferase, partial [Aerococcus mictus]